MRSKYGNLSRQKFNVTIVRNDGEEQSAVGFKLRSQIKSVLLCTMIYIVRSDGEQQSIVGFKFMIQMKSVLICTMIQVLLSVSLEFSLCAYCNGMLVCQAQSQGINIKNREIVGELSQNFGKFSQTSSRSPKKKEIKSIWGTSVHKILFTKFSLTVCELFVNTEP